MKPAFAPRIALLIALLTALLLSLAPRPATGQEAPERLFFSAEERRQLDARHHDGPVGAAADTTLRLDGLVLRGDGQHVLWLNGHPHSRPWPAGLAPTPWGMRQGTQELHPGDSLDGVGHHHPLLPAGSITVRRTTP